ncbi:MAG: type II secretion system ATPase GspE [Verrucomicrobia bacterium]|nr:type II secretion system ATPase GspE [Verrucomicrobiota bacterium]
MTVYDQEFLGTLLVELGIVTSAQLKEAVEERERTGKMLGHILVDFGFIGERDLLNVIADNLGMEVVDLKGLEIPDDVIKTVEPAIARAYGIIPVAEENGTIIVALSDPLNPTILDDLHFMLDKHVRGAIADKEDIEDAITRHYGDAGGSVEDLLKEIESGIPITEVDEEHVADDVISLRELATEAPVVKLLNLVLIQAIKDRASDIHFEPFENEFKIRYRVDGVLYEMMPPPKHLALALTCRIKVLANLNISERRLPQDGRIQINVLGRQVDLRVSSLPTAFGESVVLRVLDRSNVQLDIEAIGMREDTLETMKELIQKPNGIIIVTGPTGSGKTTSLYSFLRTINRVEDKLITTEDPVEYDLEGVVQVPINARIGLTFARCLRSILRQDPDRIMVGEIRDVETAALAIQASLTGHLVLSTLHTNDAAGTITRLVDIGVEPFLITSTLEAILAQRLIRTVCPRCKTPFKPTEFALNQLGLTLEDTEGKELFYGRGCPDCNDTGYLGRTGIFELLQVTDPIRELIIRNAPTVVIRQKAREQGMRTLREEGILKIYDGETTIEEVSRET